MKYYKIENKIIVDKIEAEECPEGYIQSDKKVVYYSDGKSCLESDFSIRKEIAARKELQKNSNQKELVKRFTDIVQKVLDETAQSRNYDSIISVCSYATSNNPKFRAEAEACVAWRDAVWEYCYEELDKFERGEREVPSEKELIEELPKLEW